MHIICFENIFIICYIDDKYHIKLLKYFKYINLFNKHLYMFLIFEIFLLFSNHLNNWKTFNVMIKKV